MAQQSVTIRRRETVVEIINNDTKIGLRFTDYERALELARVVRYMARGIINFARTHIDVSTTVHRDGDRVIIEKGGTVFLDLEADNALVLGNAIQSKAKEVEEIAKANDITFDQALLVRRGLATGLSGRQDIIEEAYKEAQYGDLRRYMPSPQRWPERIGRISVVQERSDNAGNGN